VYGRRLTVTKYTDGQKTAALDAVDEAVAGGSSVNAALKQVGADHGIAPGTIRSWRARTGRSQPVGDRTASAAAAGAALVAATDEALAEHLDAGRKFTVRAVALLKSDPATAARVLTAATSAKGASVDKLVKLGRLEGAERVHASASVSVEDLRRLSDEELAAMADGVLPS